MSSKKSKAKHKSRKAPVAAKAKNTGGKRRSTKAKSRKRQRNRRIEIIKLEPRGLGTRAGTGSGDMQDISIVEDATSESVEELLEEGQAFEAAFVSGVEDAPPADKSPVRTREPLSDDVPPECDERRLTLGTQEED